MAGLSLETAMRRIFSSKDGWMEGQSLVHSCSAYHHLGQSCVLVVSHTPRGQGVWDVGSTFDLYVCSHKVCDFFVKGFFF